MNAHKFILAILIFIGFNSYSQEDTIRECDRMRFLAGESLKQAKIVEDQIKSTVSKEDKDRLEGHRHLLYAETSMYYLRGETICGNYDAKQFARMIGSLRNTKNSTEDKERQKAYADTLEAVWQRAEEQGFYDQSEDFIRGANILNSSTPNRAKADELFRRGINSQGTSTNEAYVSYFYYNTYAMWAEEKAAVKNAALKKRMISEYFELSALIVKAKMSVKTQETITTYFDYVVRDCGDILPELKDYIKNLPSDTASKKLAVNNFIELLEKKQCIKAPEYIQLINIYVDLDPTSLDGQMKKAKAQAAKGDKSGAIATLKKAKELSTDAAQKQEISYMIALEQFNLGQYSTAYTTAMSISGEYKGRALIIAGKSVGQNANNCGTSTFERSCNYIYAIQLLQQGNALGASDSGSISVYKSKVPTAGIVFDNGSPTSVTLSCYGVTVDPTP